MGSLVVGSSYSSEAFLSCSIPDLKFDDFSLDGQRSQWQVMNLNRKSTPMVARQLYWKESSANRLRRELLPTELFPMITTLKRQSYSLIIIDLQSTPNNFKPSYFNHESSLEDQTYFTSFFKQTLNISCLSVIIIIYIMITRLVGRIQPIFLAGETPYFRKSDYEKTQKPFFSKANKGKATSEQPPAKKINPFNLASNLMNQTTEKELQNNNTTHKHFANTDKDNFSREFKEGKKQTKKQKELKKKQAEEQKERIQKQHQEIEELITQIESRQNKKINKMIENYELREEIEKEIKRLNGKIQSAFMKQEWSQLNGILQNIIDNIQEAQKRKNPQNSSPSSKEKKQNEQQGTAQEIKGVQEQEVSQKLKGKKFDLQAVGHYTKLQFYHYLCFKNAKKLGKWLSERGDFSDLPGSSVKTILLTLMGQKNWGEVIDLASKVKKEQRIGYFFLQPIFAEINPHGYKSSLQAALSRRIQAALILLQRVSPAHYTQNPSSFYKGGIVSLGNWFTNTWKLVKEKRVCQAQFAELFENIFQKHYKNIIVLEAHSSGTFIDILENYYYGSHITTERLEKLLKHVLTQRNLNIFLIQLRNSMRMYYIKKGDSPFPNATGLFEVMKKKFMAKDYQSAILFYVLCHYNSSANFPFGYFESKPSLFQILKVDNRFRSLMIDGLLNLPDEVLVSSEVVSRQYVNTSDLIEQDQYLLRYISDIICKDEKKPKKVKEQKVRQQQEWQKLLKNKKPKKQESKDNKRKKYMIDMQKSQELNLVDQSKSFFNNKNKKQAFQTQQDITNDHQINKVVIIQDSQPIPHIIQDISEKQLREILGEHFDTITGVQEFIRSRLEDVKKRVSNLIQESEEDQFFSSGEEFFDNQNIFEHKNQKKANKIEFLHRLSLRLECQREGNFYRSELLKILISSKDQIERVKAAIKLGKHELAFTIFKQNCLKNLIDQRMARTLEFVAKAFLREHQKTTPQLAHYSDLDSISLEAIKIMAHKQFCKQIKKNPNFDMFGMLYERLENFDKLHYKDLPSQTKQKHDFWESMLMMERSQELVKMDISGKLDQITYEPQYERLQQREVSQFNPNLNWRDELLHGLGVANPEPTPINNKKGAKFIHFDSEEAMDYYVVQPMLQKKESTGNLMNYKELIHAIENPASQYQIEESAEGEETVQAEATQETQIVAEEEPVEGQIEGEQEAYETKNIYEHSKENGFLGYDFNTFLQEARDIKRPQFQEAYEEEKNFIKYMLALEAIAEQARIGDNQTLQKKMYEAQHFITKPSKIAQLIQYGLWNYDFLTVEKPIQLIYKANTFRELFFEYKKYMGTKMPGWTPDLSRNRVKEVDYLKNFHLVTPQLIEELLLLRHDLFKEAEAVVKLQDRHEVEELMLWGAKNHQPIAIYFGQKMAMLTNQKISHPTALTIARYLSHKRDVPEDRIVRCKEALQIVGRINREHIYDLSKDYEHITIRKQFRKYVEKRMQELQEEPLSYLTSVDPLHYAESFQKHHTSRPGLTI